MKRGIEEANRLEDVLILLDGLIKSEDLEGTLEVALEGLDFYKSVRFTSYILACGSCMNAIPINHENTRDGRLSFLLGYAKSEGLFGHRLNRSEARVHLLDASNQGFAFATHYMTVGMPIGDERVNLLMKSVAAGVEDSMGMLRRVLVERPTRISQDLRYRAHLLLHQIGRPLRGEVQSYPYSQWEPEKHCQSLQSDHAHEEQKIMLLIAKRDKRLKPVRTLILRYISCKN